MSAEADQMVKATVQDIVDMQRGLEEFESGLAIQNEQIRNFLETQKTTKQQIDDTWKLLLDQMIQYNVKSVKGKWGSITVTIRSTVKADLSKLDSKFTKVVADDKKIRSEFDLTGDLPEGAEIVQSAPYLTKRLK